MSKRMNKEKISLAELYKLKDKILNADKGNSYIIVDDKKYTIDTDYALEGIEIFFDVLERSKQKNEWLYERKRKTWICNYNYTRNSW